MTFPMSEENGDHLAGGTGDFEEGVLAEEGLGSVPWVGRAVW